MRRGGERVRADPRDGGHGLDDARVRTIDVTLRLVGPDGVPLGGARAKLTELPEPAGRPVLTRSRDIYTDEAGRSRIPFLKPGAYRWRVYRDSLPAELEGRGTVRIESGGEVILRAAPRRS